MAWYWLFEIFGRMWFVVRLRSPWRDLDCWTALRSRGVLKKLPKTTQKFPNENVMDGLGGSWFGYAHHDLASLTTTGFQVKCKKVTKGYKRLQRLEKFGIGSWELWRETEVSFASWTLKLWAAGRFFIYASYSKKQKSIQISKLCKIWENCAHM